jgi:predicted  nucleic acid-binding Zn-ribbon protein
MLSALREVQALDLRRDALAAERQDVPAPLVEARAQHEALQARLGPARQEHEALRRAVASAELELRSLQDRRKEAVAGAQRASSTKEASQYQNQEIQFATRAQELEDDTLDLMRRFEEKEEVVAGLQGEVDAATPALAALEEAERQRLADLETQDGDLAMERARLCASIDGALLKQYEQVRRARRGLALVQVQNGKHCGGCHVQLPMHVVQKVARGDGVIRCPSCGRLLIGA